MDEPHILIGTEDKSKNTTVRKVTSKFKSSLPQYHLILAASTVILIVSLIIGLTYQNKKTGTVSQDDPSSPSLSDTWQVSDPTEGWKEYSNSKYNYSLKYPPSLFLLEYKTAENVSFSSTKPPVPVGQMPWVVSITVQDNPKGLDAKAYVDEMLSQIVPSMDELEITREKVFVGGMEGEMVLGLPSRSGTMDIFVPLEDNVFVFMLDPYDPDVYPEIAKESVPIFNQILSTFKFLDFSQEEVSEEDIIICDVDSNCIVVDYSHCCGQTKRAINEKYKNLYDLHLEWQKFDDPQTCAVIGVCPPDSYVKKATCNENNRCQLKFPN